MLKVSHTKHCDRYSKLNTDVIAKKTNVGGSEHKLGVIDEILRNSKVLCDVLTTVEVEGKDCKDNSDTDVVTMEWVESLITNLLNLNMELVIKKITDCKSKHINKEYKLFFAISIRNIFRNAIMSNINIMKSSKIIATRNTDLLNTFNMLRKSITIYTAKF